MCQYVAKNVRDVMMHYFEKCLFGCLIQSQSFVSKVLSEHGLFDYAKN